MSSGSYIRAGDVSRSLQRLAVLYSAGPVGCRESNPMPCPDTHSSPRWCQGNRPWRCFIRIDVLQSRFSTMAIPACAARAHPPGSMRRHLEAHAAVAMRKCVSDPPVAAPVALLPCASTTESPDLIMPDVFAKSNA